MVSIESMLTRQLDLRFIDARTLAAEARLALGIEGYPCKDDIHLIATEAVRIFQQKSHDEKQSMQELHWNLEAVKLLNDAMSIGESSVLDSPSEDRSSVVSSSSQSLSSCRRGGGIRSLFRR